MNLVFVLLSVFLAIGFMNHWLEFLENFRKYLWYPKNRRIEGRFALQGQALPGLSSNWGSAIMAQLQPNFWNPQTCASILAELLCPISCLLPIDLGGLGGCHINEITLLESFAMTVVIFFTKVQWNNCSKLPSRKLTLATISLPSCVVLPSLCHTAG